MRQLGERHIKSRPHFAARACVHRRAEASTGGLRAIDGDDKAILSPRLVDRIDIGSFQKDAILHAQSCQFAGPYAHEGVPRRRVARNLHLPAAGRAIGRGQGGQRGEQIPLPRVWSDDISEQGVVVTAFQAVFPGFLHVGDAARQIVYRPQLVVDNRPLRHGRADDSVTIAQQHVEQNL